MIEHNEVLAMEQRHAIDYLQKRASVFESKPESFFVFADPETTDKKEEIYSIDGDTATIKIEGVLSHGGPDMIDKVFGVKGTSYNSILEAVETIAEKDAVKTVRLEMNTPGGGVQGADSVFQAVQMLAGRKKVYAINNGLIASAGYWIASAATEIVGLTPTVETGAIGVVITAFDRSDSRVVRIVSRNAPNKKLNASTEEGKQALQDRADAIERIFFQRISEGRGIALETIKNDFGRGGLLVAQDPEDGKKDATNVGMIDRVIYEAEAMPTAAFENKISLNDTGDGAREDEEEIPTEEIKMSDPKVEATVDASLVAELVAVKAERDALQVRIDKATPFINAEYPAKFRELAVKVLAGDSKPEALEGAVVAYDALKEEGKIVAAIEDSAANAEVNGASAVETDAIAQDGTISTLAEYENSVKEMRALRGIVE